jgi:chemotaxis protein histidine kinase CheA
MNLEPAPRLPKWIFLAIDAGLLLIAFVIVYFAKDPYAPLPFVSAVLCAALAAVVGLVPFLVDFAADTAEAVERERERINDQVARLHAATESLARAAAQIKAVEEAVHKSARDAETLPYRMQEKLAEFNEALAAKEESDREALETELEELRAANSDQLKATAEKIAQATADWSALEVATRQHLAAAQTALTKLHGGAGDAAAQFEAKVSAALHALDAKIAALKSAAARVPLAAVAAAEAPHPTPHEPPARPAPAPADAAPATEISAPAPAPDSTSSPADAAPASETPAAAAEPPKPKKPRAPRKPKPEDMLAAMSDAPAAASAPESSAETAPAASPEPAAAALESPAAASAASSSSSEENGDSPAAGPAESSTSSDGATRLLATAYIGIGNKLFIRGDGPGLSWDHGIPMQFVSIGKWGWSTHDAAGPVRCKLYKNDETAALTGELVLEAGRHTEVTALF